MSTTTNKKIIIHAGLGKTGTSAIQNFAFTELISSEELCYVPIGLIEECHNALTDSHPKFSEGEYKTHLDNICDFILASSAEKFLISSEFFVNTSIPNMKLLVDAFVAKSIEVQIIIVIRNYISLLSSAYLQALKTAYGLLYGESALDYAMRSYELFRLPYQIRRWMDAGAQNIVLLDYDNHRDNLIQSFLFSCGIEKSVNFKKNINSSLIFEFVPLIRNFDKCFKGERSDRRNVLINQLLLLSNQFRDVSYSKEVFGGKRAWFEKMYADDVSYISSLGVKII